ncbi:MAG: hypothetical protein ACWGQW_10325 [bacterium]
MRVRVVGVVGSLFLSLLSTPGLAELAETAEEICPLLPGAKIPAAKLQRVDGTPFYLSHEVKQRPSIVIFYRGSW